MSASKLEIRARHREHMGVVVSLADFQWAQGEAIDAESLVDDRRFSLYCLDHDSQRAIFTSTPADVEPPWTRPSCIRRNSIMPSTWLLCPIPNSCVSASRCQRRATCSACIISGAAAPPSFAAPSTRSMMSCPSPSRTR